MNVLDGRKLAEGLRSEIRRGVDAFQAQHSRAPGLDVVLVGEDPPSIVYTRSKERAAKEVGMVSRLHTLPATTTEGALLALLADLNHDPYVDGVLVQLPLPVHIRRDRVLDAIAPGKDVDGFHPINVGLLGIGRPNLTPCTPLGCLALLDSAGVELRGLHAVVVGCSNIVGKPMAQLLLQREATVTLAHKETRDLASLCRTADVLVVATGCPELIRGAWVKPGVVVIDVGINRITTPEGTIRIVGDVAFAEVCEKAHAITPVPGGVGPLTIAHLLLNTLRAAEARVNPIG